MSYFIKYPEFIPAPIIVTSTKSTRKAKQEQILKLKNIY
jgi:hypothetical protein